MQIKKILQKGGEYELRLLGKPAPYLVHVKRHFDDFLIATYFEDEIYIRYDKIVSIKPNRNFKSLFEEGLDDTAET